MLSYALKLFNVSNVQQFFKIYKSMSSIQQIAGFEKENIQKPTSEKSNKKKCFFCEKEEDIFTKVHDFTQALLNDSRKMLELRKAEGFLYSDKKLPTSIGGKI